MVDPRSGSVAGILTTRPHPSSRQAACPSGHVIDSGNAPPSRSRKLKSDLGFRRVHDSLSSESPVRRAGIASAELDNGASMRWDSVARLVTVAHSGS